MLMFNRLLRLYYYLRYKANITKLVVGLSVISDVIRALKGNDDCECISIDEVLRGVDSCNCKPFIDKSNY